MAGTLLSHLFHVNQICLRLFLEHFCRAYSAVQQHRKELSVATPTKLCCAVEPRHGCSCRVPSSARCRDQLGRARGSKQQRATASFTINKWSRGSQARVAAQIVIQVGFCKSVIHSWLVTWLILFVFPEAKVGRNDMWKSQKSVS